jgi:hypothetical protein
MLDLLSMGMGRVAFKIERRRSATGEALRNKRKGNPDLALLLGGLSVDKQTCRPWRDAIAPKC